MATGKELFESSGCAQCHKLNAGDSGAASFKNAKKLRELRDGKGCLAETPAAGLPNYELNAAQRAAISALLKKGEAKADEKSAIQFHLANNNCVACHVRDSLGGPEPSRDALFVTRMQEMGNEGRLPPPLTGVGDKLRPEYLQQVIANGAKERPYMGARMPGFGEKIGQTLTTLLVKADLQETKFAERTMMVRWLQRDVSWLAVKGWHVSSVIPLELRRRRAFKRSICVAWHSD